MRTPCGNCTPTAARGPNPSPKRQRGLFVAVGYTADAEQECAAFHRKSGRIIKLITVQEILDEQHVQKM